MIGINLSTIQSRSSVVCLVIYRSGSDIDTFLSEFTAILETVAVYNCNVVITGDFNIHVDDALDRDARRFLDLLESFGLSQCVTGPTHKQGHTLDLVITRSDLPLPEISVEPPLISDHSVVNFLVPLQRPPLRMVDVSPRAWKGFDKENFRKDLLNSRLCMPQDYQNLSVDDLQQTYDSVLASLLDKHAPFRSMRVPFDAVINQWLHGLILIVPLHEGEHGHSNDAIEGRNFQMIDSLGQSRYEIFIDCMLLSRTHFGKQRSRTVIQIQKNFGRHYHVYSAKINPERQSRPTVRWMLRISSRLSRLRWNLSGHQRCRHHLRSSRMTNVLPFSTSSLTLTPMKLWSWCGGRRIKTASLIRFQPGSSRNLSGTSHRS